jgi:hypothetical protein
MKSLTFEHAPMRTYYGGKGRQGPGAATWLNKYRNIPVPYFREKKSTKKLAELYLFNTGSVSVWFKNSHPDKKKIPNPQHIRTGTNLTTKLIKTLPLFGANGFLATVAAFRFLSLSCCPSRIFSTLACGVVPGVAVFETTCAGGGVLGEPLVTEAANLAAGVLPLSEGVGGVATRGDDT